MRLAFLFSCMIGLHRFDIYKMVWNEVYAPGNWDRIVFKQKQTQRTIAFRLKFGSLPDTKIAR